MIGQGELKIGTDMAYVIFSFSNGRLAVADPGQTGQRTCMNLMRRLYNISDVGTIFMALNAAELVVPVIRRASTDAGTGPERPTVYLTAWKVNCVLDV
jgi:hypothetical protein